MGLEKENDAPIGLFDSGLGGINVLVALLRVLPGENYIFLGDTANNPYGDKSLAKVRSLTKEGIDFLLSEGAKAIVVACNTATSAVIENLRQTLAVPVFGIEPAIKPAVMTEGHGKILLMATPLTIKEKKLIRLMNSLPDKESVISLACPGLAELIEAGDGEAAVRRIKELLAEVDTTGVTGVVLGCTHYPLIRQEIQQVLGRSVRFYDGAEGLARNVRRVLAQEGKLRSVQDRGQVRFIFTGDDREARALRARAIVARLQEENLLASFSTLTNS